VTENSLWEDREVYFENWSILFVSTRAGLYYRELISTQALKVTGSIQSSSTNRLDFTGDAYSWCWGKVVINGDSAIVLTYMLDTLNISAPGFTKDNANNPTFQLIDGYADTREVLSVITGTQWSPRGYIYFQGGGIN
jgi:hypothetical protein